MSLSRDAKEKCDKFAGCPDGDLVVKVREMSIARYGLHGLRSRNLYVALESSKTAPTDKRHDAF